ncbi:glycine-rich selenoprotein-like [Culicoides brevitarsis]|uniref:glycine-rich selenoprotein-like n=1 Tax=Culicoides brevitarsis TaxID=469753 RepID=UPI00307C7638
MVYVNRDGTVSQSRPWSLNRLWEMIMGFFTGVYLFFATLFSDLVPNKNNSNPRSSGGRGPGSGPGSGGGGSNRGQPAGYGRRIGRVVNMDDCNIPGGG